MKLLKNGSVKTKVYLSKSKAGSHEDLMKVRSMLAKLDVEVFEFSGGDFNTSKIQVSDAVLILPPAIPEVWEDAVSVGKGQTIELEAAMLHNIPQFVVRSVEELIVVSVDGHDVENLNWTTEYAFVYFDAESDVNLTECLKLKSVVEPIVVKAKSRLLLACVNYM